MAEASGDQLANLHLDEVTGEKVRSVNPTRKSLSFRTHDLLSKSELKKRQKQRTLEEKKKEKAAAAPSKPKPEKTASAEEEESQLTPNVRSIDPG